MRKIFSNVSELWNISISLEIWNTCKFWDFLQNCAKVDFHENQQICTVRKSGN